MVDTTLLDKAKAAVTDRQAVYGSPREDMLRIAGAWSALFGWRVAPEQVALAMEIVKISRAVQSHHEDNAIDGCGYWQVYESVLNDAPQETSPVTTERLVRVHGTYGNNHGIVASVKDESFLVSASNIVESHDPYQELKIGARIRELGIRSHEEFLVIEKTTRSPNNQEIIILSPVNHAKYDARLDRVISKEAFNERRWIIINNNPSEDFVEKLLQITSSKTVPEFATFDWVACGDILVWEDEPFLKGKIIYRSLGKNFSFQEIVNASEITLEVYAILEDGSRSSLTRLTMNQTEFDQRKWKLIS